MNSVSVICPVQPTDIGIVAQYAKIASVMHRHRLWCGQSFNIETSNVFAALTGMGFDLAFGAGVTLIPLRHPATAAVCARSVARLSGHPYIVGLGPGSRSLQRGMMGLPYESALQATRNYILAVRELLESGFSKRTPDSNSGGEIGIPPMESPPVSVGIGVLRSGMARLCGEIADAAITWLAPHRYIGDVIREAVEAGAEQAGRERPEIISVVHCAVDRPGRDLQRVAYHAAGAHLSSPHYVDMLNKAGVKVDADDPWAGSAKLVDQGVLVSGDAAEIARSLREYHKNGVSEVVVNVGGVHLAEGPGAAIRDLVSIMRAAGGTTAR